MPTVLSVTSVGNANKLYYVCLAPCDNGQHVKLVLVLSRYSSSELIVFGLGIILGLAQEQSAMQSS